MQSHGKSLLTEAQKMVQQGALKMVYYRKEHKILNKIQISFKKQVTDKKSLLWRLTKTKQNPMKKVFEPLKKWYNRHTNMFVGIERSWILN